MKKHSLRGSSNIFSIYKGFPKATYILFICRLINSMGYFVFPFLTLFLTINLSLSADKVGLYLMCVEISRIIGALFGGKFTDIFGRKRTLIGFQFAMVFFLLPCAFLENSLVIPRLLIIAAFFNGAIRPVYDAMMVDLSNPQNRKEIFSFIYLGINLGFGVGSLIAGFLYTRYIKLLFLGNVAVILIVCFFIYLFINETLPYETRLENKKNKSVKEESLISMLKKKPTVLYFSLVSIFFYLAHSQYFFGLPLQINDIFGLAGPRYFGLVMSFNCLVVVFMTMPLTVVSRQNKPIFNVYLSGIFFAIGFGMLYWINQFSWILISTFTWTIGEVLTHINAGVYIANHSPVTHRGRFNSLVIISESFSRIIGPPVLGLVITNLGIRKIWVLIFFISIVAAGLIYLIYLAEKKVAKNKKLSL